MESTSLNTARWERSVYTIIACWGLLALIFAIWDLQISFVLVDRQAGWAQLVADYGEVPGNIVIIVALMVFYVSKKEGNPVTHILIIGGIIGGLFWQVHALVTTFVEDPGSQYILIIAFFIMFFLVGIRKGNIMIPEEFQAFSVITLLLAIINPLIFVQAVKNLWGRVRFRDLAPNFTNYTPWYLPQGLTGHRSFPSGHAAMGWMLLPLLHLPQIRKNKAVYYLCMGIIAGWGGIVALGRVVIGAHFASDTLFSTGMAWVVFLVLDNYFQKKQTTAHVEEKTSV